MDLDGRERRRNRAGGGCRGQVFARQDAQAPGVPDLDRERWGHLDFVDLVAYHEGEFVGFWLGIELGKDTPYDWAVE